jgi:signal transduction histidine kinase
MGNISGNDRRNEFGEPIGHGVSSMRRGIRLALEKTTRGDGCAALPSELEAILEGLMDGVIVTDREDRVWRINGRGLLYLDKSFEEVAGRSVAEVLTGIEDDRGLKAPLWTYVPAAGGGTIRIKGRVIVLQSSAFRGRDGETGGTVYTLKDETRLAELEERATGGDKFSLTGETAVNIAHEIRNPLGSIELYASLLMKDLRGAKARARAQQIIASVKSIDNKISNFLLFAKGERPVSQDINIHDILREILMFSEQIVDQEAVFLSVRYAKLEPRIKGDAAMLKQVFLNLILNALQAMPHGGCLTIETRPGEKDAEGGLRESTIEVRFLDNGIGIPRETLPKIFDPFFITKDKGSGLGLAIVRHIVGMHGGSIHVESLQEGGTAFSIAFPLIKNHRNVNAL